jgi:sulfopyruvate decarboxylase subunit beta
MTTRTEALLQIISPLKDELLIASCGFISRDIYYLKDRNENFYVQSAMGSTLGVALGVALNTRKQVVAVLGDGEALMSLGSLALFRKLKLPNLKLFIIDNNQYESTGGQRTCSDALDFKEICDCTIFKVSSSPWTPPRIPLSSKQLKERFMRVLNPV